MITKLNLIPERLVDKTTVVKNHTIYTHLFCVILRIFIGYFYPRIPKKIFIMLAIFVVLTFGYKFFFNTGTWKNYLRTTLIYLLLIFINNDVLAQSLIFMDALMAQQSRFIATLLLE